MVVIAAASVMQSCFVAKNYERPQVKTEALYRTDATATEGASLAGVSWKTLFTDPILQGYIEKGLQNNYDIRIAMQSIVAAEANLKQGKMGYLPTFSVGASLTHQELAKNSQFGSFFGLENIRKECKYMI